MEATDEGAGAGLDWWSGARGGSAAAAAAANRAEVDVKVKSEIL